jgi:hypothetical protein
MQSKEKEGWFKADVGVGDEVCGRVGRWGVWGDGRAAEILPTPPLRAPLLGGDFLV